MNAKDAGRRGGRRQSHAKRAAARANGARGGRPSAAEALIRRMREMHAKIRAAGGCPDIDPDDLDLIIERLCRDANSSRVFFIFPQKNGGYAY